MATAHSGRAGAQNRPLQCSRAKPFSQAIDTIVDTMKDQRRIARHQQYAALYLGAQLEADKQKYFLGSAKVDIDSFRFDPHLPRDKHSQNSERLLSAYELVGCSQLDPSNHIPAVIDDAEFEQALSSATSTRDMALARDHSKWPVLKFSGDLSVECLRGKHRIDAARVYLRPGLRWWVVDFYSKSDRPCPLIPATMTNPPRSE